MKRNYKVFCLIILSLGTLVSPLTTHAEDKMDSNAGVGFYGEYKPAPSPNPDPGGSGEPSKVEPSEPELVLTPGHETGTTYKQGRLPQTGTTTHSWLPVVGYIILGSTIGFVYWYKNKKQNKKWSV